MAEDVYAQVERYALALFARGTELAAAHGLILVDTKYEFGLLDGKVVLIDEIHTPDSSRYFYAEGYEERFAKGEEQRQLSKEFVRQWLISRGFVGKPGQQVPEMTEAYCEEVSSRYIELYERITGKKFGTRPHRRAAPGTHLGQRGRIPCRACRLLTSVEGRVYCMEKRKKAPRA